MGRKRSDHGSHFAGSKAITTQASLLSSQHNTRSAARKINTPFVWPAPFDLPNCQLYYIDKWLSDERADKLLHALESELPWRQDEIRLFGRNHRIPRLQAWIGDQGAVYQYSQLTMQPLPWTDSLLQLKQSLKNIGLPNFNSVLANLYRDGQDSMGWHSDDEPELGQHPIIASVTLGATRPFKLRSKTTRETHKIELGHGSLLIMAGETQRFYDHSIAKTAKDIGPRINLTFRVIHP